MGTWGVGNFENDDAMDWIQDLQNSNDISFITSTFSKIIEGNYLEAPECANALAAAEVVAALGRNPSTEDLPPEITAWVSSNKSKINYDLTIMAQKTCEKIKQSSELKELWAESDNFDEWKNIINNLLFRLKSFQKNTASNEVVAELPLSFNDWLSKKWYIFAIIAGLGAALAQLFISRYSVMIGLIFAYAVSYLIYKSQNL